ncbi:Hypothetical Protein FCC1311_005122 [Hondaea fermentalgiana]|uniref:Uncharacterized protein n=1 Tax=Hondaea fermentalgiana TaxID=2315210 RepID=A0A2R5G9E7_9STRA|nr:Hypothetical Protein FCC1311_005122 [Hondaea fermentalgiana]|eukprot:GBG24294.1 Hypothetical Protein FCC1311_005122 [Hondaea fermentalgiana]
MVPLATAARGLCRAGSGSSAGEGASEEVVAKADAAYLAAGFAAAEAERLLRGLLAMRTVQDLRVAAAVVPEVLEPGAQRMAVFTALGSVLEHGLATSPLALECARWVCVDARMRRCMLRETDFLMTALGAALAAEAAVDADIANKKHVEIVPQSELAVCILEDCLEVDAYWTRRCCSRLRLAKSLRKLADRQQTRGDGAFLTRLQRVLGACELSAP